MDKRKLSIAALLVVPALMFACNSGGSADPEKPSSFSFEDAKNWVNEHQGTLKSVTKIEAEWNFSGTNDANWDIATTTTPNNIKNDIFHDLCADYLGSGYFNYDDLFVDQIVYENKSDSNTKNNPDGTYAKKNISYSDFSNSGAYSSFNKFEITDSKLTMERTTDLDLSDHGFVGGLKAVIELNENSVPMVAKITFNNTHAAGDGWSCYLTGTVEFKYTL